MLVLVNIGALCTFIHCCDVGDVPVFLRGGEWLVITLPFRCPSGIYDGSGIEVNTCYKHCMGDRFMGRCDIASDWGFRCLMCGKLVFEIIQICLKIDALVMNARIELELVQVAGQIKVQNASEICA